MSKSKCPKKWTADAILSALASMPEEYPDEAIKAASKQREELSPRLIRMLEAALEVPDMNAAPPPFPLIYAMMLLGHFHETRAHAAIVGLASLPIPRVESLLGDVMLGPLPMVLFSTCGGSFEEIQRLGCQPGAAWECRWAAARSLTFGVAAGQFPRDQALSFLLGQLEEAARPETPNFYGAQITNCLRDLCPREAMAAISKAYANGAIVPDYGIDLKEIQDDLALGIEGCLKPLRDDMRCESLDDIADRFYILHLIQSELMPLP